MLDAGKYRRWGVELNASGGGSFRIWAPDSGAPKLVLNGETLEMRSEGNGWYEANAYNVKGGELYHFLMADGRKVADPASHWQGIGPEGPSTVVDHRFSWQYDRWIGRPWHEAVIYEVRVGTFTEEGTFIAASTKLQRLADIGITAIELMPLATFEGDRGWGYDGVMQFAPQRNYGSPDDLKTFIDTAHGCGMMVLLDVVYNHFGPEGNVLQNYAPTFFKKNDTPWGPAPDFEKAAVRSLFVQNALYWLETYRFDGLRIDAADHLAGGDGEIDFLGELAQNVRASIKGRQAHIVIEDARNAVSPMSAEGDVPPLIDAQWNDDFHHVIHVLTTGEDGGIYADFASDPQQSLRRSLATGFVYQGEPRPSRGYARSGEPSGELCPNAFVNFLHNHDQAGNRLCGERLRTLIGPSLFGVLECILLLCPQTPLMFMGDDHASTQPFFFFSHHPRQDREEGIRARLRQADLFQGNLPPDAPSLVKDPNDPGTFALSTLDWRNAEKNEGKTASGKMAGLLSKRRQYVWPLLTSEFIQGEALDSPEKTLAVDWTFAAGCLQLRANLSDHADKLPAVKGEIFHRHSDSEASTELYHSHAALFAILRQ